jgi:hypothetical protein
VADTHSKLSLVGRPTDTPRIPANSIAIEALSVARECVEALALPGGKTEIRLGAITDLLDNLELTAILALQNGRMK